MVDAEKVIGLLSKTEGKEADINYDKPLTAPVTKPKAVNSVEFDYTSVNGLSTEEAERILVEEGPNELEAHKPRSIFWIVLEVMKEPMFLMLLACAGLYFGLGDWKEGIMLAGFVFFIIGITIYQERKTERALDALRDLSSPRATVIRDGKQITVAGKDIVRGDYVLLKEGDRVPADLALLWVSNLTVDESLLTGESVPVRKSEGDENTQMATPGGEDTPLCFSGTLLVTGRAVGIVKVTGQHTEIGKIGKSLAGVKEEKTPLENETRRLVLIMGTIGGICSLAIFLYYGATEQVKINKEKHGNAIFAFNSSSSSSLFNSSSSEPSTSKRDSPWLEGALMGVAVGMGLLPEEFPVVLTVFLSLGAWRISRSHVLARKNKAIETLGSCSVLCSDKTGTLTQNRMSVDTLWTATGATHKIVPGEEIPEDFHRIVEYGLLSSQQDPFDPMETAIKRLATEELIDNSHTHSNWKMIREYPLSKQLLSMSRVWVSPDHQNKIIAAKGAPEAIADLCHLGEADMQKLSQAINLFASKGLRLLGVAEAEFTSESELPSIQHDYEFRFIGLIGYADPVRPGIKAAISACKTAGIQVIMITGDYPITASNIGKEIGLEYPENIVTGAELSQMDPDTLMNKIRTTSIFARVVPEQKLQIVDALKSNKQIVAMTGDGVNDAPALKSAHIGIAMGERGTDVAREAAALVLLDDNFNSIVKAVALGRRIFDNLCKAMGYVIAIHVPLAGLALVPILLKWDEVLYPTHIVFLELIIDPACSVILEAEEADPDIMDRPPRDLKKHMVNWSNALISFAQGSMILGFALLAYWYDVKYLNHWPEEGNVIAFATLIAGNLCLIFENRSRTMWFGQMVLRKNFSMYVTYCIAVPAFFLVVYCPGLRDIFHFSHDGQLAPIEDIGIGTALGILALVWVEIYKIGYQLWLWKTGKGKRNLEIELDQVATSEGSQPPN